jgi:tryptophan-rich sensory protein
MGGSHIPAIQDPLTDAVGLIVSLAATFAVAAGGTRATLASLRTWYPELKKPDWVPSGRTIGLVWTVLYVLMAVAAWLVWRELGLAALIPLVVYSVQLVLNALWSILFFRRRNPRAAFVEVVVLWLAVLATLLDFWGISVLAGLLFVPYLAWVTFAANLNRIIARMNPQASVP